MIGSRGIPFFEGEKNIVTDPILRPASRDDCELIAAWLNAPEIHAMLSSNLRCGGVNAAALALGLRRRDQLWTIFSPGRDAPPAGLIALDNIDAIDSIANIWFLLGDGALRGKGLTSAAIERFCSDNPAGLHVLTAWIIEGNAASVACLVKAGFKECGRIAQAAQLAGKRRDRILMQRVIGPS